MNDIVVEIDELENEEPEVVDQAEPEVTEPQTPADRFESMTKEDVVKSYKEIEKAFSRQGQEIGDLRKMTESFISQQPDKQRNPIDVDSLLENPDDAINRGVTENPAILGLQQELAQLKASEAKNALTAKHGKDWGNTVQSDDFMDWVSGSRVRQRLYQEANNWDFDSADELLTLFQERQQYANTKEVIKESEAKRKADLRDATSEGAGSGPKSKKTYRAFDLQQLQTQHPDKYEAMQDEILRAYAEGRVKGV